MTQLFEARFMRKAGRPESAQMFFRAAEELESFAGSVTDCLPGNGGGA